MVVSEMISELNKASDGNNQIRLVDEVGNGVIYIANDCDTDEAVILTSKDSEGITKSKAMELLEKLNPDATVVTSENVYINKVIYERVTRSTLVCSR